MTISVHLPGRRFVRLCLYDLDVYYSPAFEGHDEDKKAVCVRARPGPTGSVAPTVGTDWRRSPRAKLLRKLAPGRVRVSDPPHPLHHQARIAGQAVRLLLLRRHERTYAFPVRIRECRNPEHARPLVGLLTVLVPAGMAELVETLGAPLMLLSKA